MVLDDVLEGEDLEAYVSLYPADRLAMTLTYVEMVKGVEPVDEVGSVELEIHIELARITEGERGNVDDLFTYTMS